MWQQRIELLRAGGIEALADNIMERWFSQSFRQHRALEVSAWRNMLTRTPLAGYIGCSGAIAATDFSQSSAGLDLPTLAIAGSEDGSTPPDVVRATAELISGSRYDKGMRMRRKVLGDAHVDAAEADKSAFDEPFQTLITEAAWGNLWARDSLPLRERSMLTIALLAAERRAQSQPRD
jgi:3-oxoadipate enol-lactonase/4-carboxymuconolactone decarboxylase